METLLVIQNIIIVYHYDAASAETAEQQHSAEQQQTSSTNTSTSSMPPNNLANTKEKTPMCLINELARYNKIQHQYRLTGEQVCDIYKILLKFDLFRN